ncbi:MAG TPA: hypothetical protein GXZ46_05250 [Actinomycetales bacterium]|nr:hypothetical protein [Actinomycetales bacterium]
MFAPLPDGVYTLFPAQALNNAIATMDRRPVAAGYLADGDIVSSESDNTKYSWLV